MNFQRCNFSFHAAKTKANRKTKVKAENGIGVAYAGHCAAIFTGTNAAEKAKKFVTVLIENFQVEEYFRKLEVNKMKALDILNEKRHTTYSMEVFKREYA